MKRYLIKNKLYLLLFILLTLVVAAMNVAVAYIIKSLSEIDQSASIIDVLTYTIYSMIFVAIFMFMEYQRKVHVSRYSRYVIENIRKDIFRVVSNLRNRKTRDFEESEILNVINNDVEMVEEQYIGGILDTFLSAVSLLFILGALMYINIYLGLIILLISFLPVIVPRAFSKKLSLEKDEISSETVKWLSEIKNLTGGLTEVFIYGAHKKANELFGAANARREKSMFRYIVTYSKVNTISGFFSTLIYVMIISIVVILRNSGMTDVGTVIAAIYLADALAMPVLNLSYNLNDIISSKKIMKKVEEIVNTEKDTSNIHEVDFKNTLSITGLNVTFGDTKVIKDLSFYIKKGEKVLITGESGAGKSTFVKCLLNIMGNSSCQYLIDGQQVNEKDIVHNFSYIAQQPMIFSGNILDNISMFDSFDKDVIRRIVNDTGLSKLIECKGSNYRIRENSSDLSGGEKQRISIARALLHDRPLFIIDEATSSLDPEAKEEIDELITNLDRTVITIAHHLSDTVIDKYDRVYELKEGKLVEYVHVGV